MALYVYGLHQMANRFLFGVNSYRAHGPWQSRRQPTEGNLDAVR